jgi:hypothetical protein
MEKKFYEMPEVEVIDLLIEDSLLAGSGPDIDDDDDSAPTIDDEI